MKWFAIVTWLGCAVALQPLSLPDRHVLFDRSVVPDGWIQRGIAHPSKLVNLTIALRQHNLDVLEKTFWDVSTPGNPQYGKFLSQDDISKIITPPEEHRAQVIDWVKSHGITEISSLSDAVHFETHVEVAEKLLQAHFYEFASPGKRTISRVMGEYSVPIQFRELIEMISGVSDFPQHRLNRRRWRPEGKPYKVGAVIPQTLMNMYSIPPNITVKNGISQGVIEFGSAEQSFSPETLKMFSEFIESEIKEVEKDHIRGPFNPETPGGECTLDIEYMGALAPKAENWYWDDENWLYDFTVQFFNSKKVPNVISISYGWSETDQCRLSPNCQSLGIDSETYVKRINVEFQKIGLRGVTILAASGDSGANGRTDGECYDEKLHPAFPGSSPYLTSVGATRVNNPVFARERDLDSKRMRNACEKDRGYQCVLSGDEQAATYEESGFTSGGGFSEYAKRPKYQEEFVKTYLQNSELPPKTYFNTEGRGYPDISALGDSILVIFEGEIQLVGGTSASSPEIAGIVTLINDYLVSKGKPMIGFLNPLLYKMAKEHPKAFHDITVGDNKCTEGGCASFCQGFKCEIGWDPVTGLGSPNFKEILKYLESVQ
uniref:Physaropepsin n=1 Tax=Hirondellea gigas TaxID=1518452 RepID=A0A6A7FSM4_9CRUS